MSPRDNFCLHVFLMHIYTRSPARNSSPCFDHSPGIPFCFVLFLLATTFSLLFTPRHSVVSQCIDPRVQHIDLSQRFHRLCLVILDLQFADLRFVRQPINAFLQLVQPHLQKLHQLVKVKLLEEFTLEQKLLKC